jgi:7SK snRNA methylphosphate capping enzyme
MDKPMHPEAKATSNDGEIPPAKKQKQTTTSKVTKSKSQKFMHGNYSNYYGYRNPSAVLDPRLAYLKKEWFIGKTCLDVGCNSGFVTTNLGKISTCLQCTQHCSLFFWC